MRNVLGNPSRVSLPGSLVIAIKASADGETKFKESYNNGGHRDRMKELMVHSATTLQPQPIRFVLRTASAIVGFHSPVRPAHHDDVVSAPFSSLPLLCARLTVLLGILEASSRN